MRTGLRSLVLWLGAWPVVVAATLLPWREIAAPAWDRGGEDDLFGYALAADGEQLLVGLPGLPTTSAPGAGAVEIYAPSAGGYTLSQRLLPTSNDADEKFGIALAVHGDDLAVGSWDAGFGNGLVPGSVHLYRRVAGLWQWRARVVAPGVDAADGFGAGLAINAEWLAVTAPGFDDATGQRGAVFLYRKAAADWVFQQRIEGLDGTRPGGFGCGLAITSTRLLIGDCRGDSPTVADTGSVHWYALGALGATLGGRINVPDLASGDQFGYAIAASEQGLLIAASTDGSDPQRANRAYFLAANSLGYDPISVQPLASFALSLQLDNDRALIAGPVCASITTPGRSVSCVRRFNRVAASWIEAPSYLQQPEVGFNGFGLALATSLDQIHVGNPFRDVAAGPAAGAISQFALADPGAVPERLELPPGLWRFAFNSAVAGNLLVASDSRLALPDQNNEGAAWVLDIGLDPPTLLARIDNPEPFGYERFSGGVGVHGDRIVLSAGKRVPGGSALVLRTYQRNGNQIDFSDEFNLFDIPALQGINWRSTLDLGLDRLALEGSVPTIKGNAPRIAVLARVGNSWALEALLSPPAQDEQLAINFSRLAMHGDRIALLRGEWRALTPEPHRWQVFVYRRLAGLWSLEATLAAQPDDPPTTLLYDLALNGDELALTSGDTLGNVLQTRIHSFRFDGSAWQPLVRIDAPAGSAEFGRQLAIENGNLLVESFPTVASNDNFVTPLRRYRAVANRWQEAPGFLPQLAPIGAGRVLEFGLPLLSGGRLFAAGRREGPGVSTHSHGVIFQFDVLDGLFADSFE